MVTFSFNGANFEELQFKMQMMQYQQLANQIIESYDFNDIKSGMKSIKEHYIKQETIGNSEKIAIIDDLFKELIGWLNKEGRKV